MQNRGLSNQIVWTEDLGSGITRYHYLDGGTTDVCVSDETHGPMDFMPETRGPEALRSVAPIPTD